MLKTSNHWLSRTQVDFIPSIVLPHSYQGNISNADMAPRTATLLLFGVLLTTKGGAIVAPPDVILRGVHSTRGRHANEERTQDPRHHLVSHSFQHGPLVGAFQLTPFVAQAPSDWLQAGPNLAQSLGSIGNEPQSSGTLFTHQLSAPNHQTNTVIIKGRENEAGTFNRAFPSQTRAPDPLLQGREQHALLPQNQPLDNTFNPQGIHPPFVNQNEPTSFTQRNPVRAQTAIPFDSNHPTSHNVQGPLGPQGSYQRLVFHQPSVGVGQSVPQAQGAGYANQFLPVGPQNSPQNGPQIPQNQPQNYLHLPQNGPGTFPQQGPQFVQNGPHNGPHIPQNYPQIPQTHPESGPHQPPTFHPPPPPPHPDHNLHPVQHARPQHSTRPHATVIAPGPNNHQHHGNHRPKPQQDHDRPSLNAVHRPHGDHRPQHHHKPSSHNENKPKTDKPTITSAAEHAKDNSNHTVSAASTKTALNATSAEGDGKEAEGRAAYSTTLTGVGPLGVYGATTGGLHGVGLGGRPYGATHGNLHGASLLGAYGGSTGGLHGFGLSGKPYGASHAGLKGTSLLGSYGLRTGGVHGGELPLKGRVLGGPLRMPIGLRVFRSVDGYQEAPGVVGYQPSAPPPHSQAYPTAPLYNQPPPMGHSQHHQPQMYQPPAQLVPMTYQHQQVAQQNAAPPQYQHQGNVPQQNVAPSTYQNEQVLQQNVAPPQYQHPGNVPQQNVAPATYQNQQVLQQNVAPPQYQHPGNVPQQNVAPATYQNQQVLQQHVAPPSYHHQQVPVVHSSIHGAHHGHRKGFHDYPYNFGEKDSKFDKARAYSQSGSEKLLGGAYEASQAGVGQLSGGAYGDDQLGVGKLLGGAYGGGNGVLASLGAGLNDGRQNPLQSRPSAPPLATLERLTNQRMELTRDLLMRPLSAPLLGVAALLKASVLGVGVDGGLTKSQGAGNYKVLTGYNSHKYDHTGQDYGFGRPPVGLYSGQSYQPQYSTGYGAGGSKQGEVAGGMYGGQGTGYGAGGVKQGGVAGGVYGEQGTGYGAGGVKQGGVAGGVYGGQGTGFGRPEQAKYEQGKGYQDKVPASGLYHQVHRDSGFDVKETHVGGEVVNISDKSLNAAGHFGGKQ